MGRVNDPRVGELGMRFGNWLARQTHRDDPVGDLARDFASDTAQFERLGRRPLTVESVMTELRFNDASDDAWVALAQAVKEWVQVQYETPGTRASHP